ncbi:MAG: hypothetical protein HY674_08670 [Chloroflexi bacterium]|nr:hypothetical protein [Chloroflexota bacterium]
MRISIKDNPRSRNRKIVLFRTPFATRQFSVKMNGQPWPKNGRPVSLTRLMTALRQTIVKTF